MSGRWTLVDAFDHGGERYIVARENQSRPEGLTKLTDREQQVVASAAAGRSTKEIAYDLGISHATTRVLLSRAYRRLGVRSRNQLFDLPCIKRLRAGAARRRAARARSSQPTRTGRPYGPGVLAEARVVPCKSFPMSDDPSIRTLLCLLP